MARTNYGEGSYRFGYQGQFAEEDTETGFNAFELRLYDPVVGRWNATDPYGQHASPYLSMSNNPVLNMDPDGGFDTRFGAWFYSITHGGGFEINGNREDGFTAARVLNDGNPSAGILNSLQVVSGWGGKSGNGLQFDRFERFLKDDYGIAIVGSGGDNVAFHNGKVAFTVNFNELSQIFGVASKDLGTRLVNHNNNNRTVSNPSLFDRINSGGKGILSLHEGVKEWKLRNPNVRVSKLQPFVIDVDTFRQVHWRQSSGRKGIDYSIRRKFSNGDADTIQSEFVYHRLLR